MPLIRGVRLGCDPNLVIENSMACTLSRLHVAVINRNKKIESENLNAQLLFYLSRV